MITLSVESDKNNVTAFFKEAGLTENEFSECLTAKDGDVILGFSLFDIDDKKITVRYINPLDNIALADGILRSTLHVAAQRFIMDAYYGDNLTEEFLKKLNFIKNADEKRLDIDKLFKSCHSCNKGDE